MNMSEASVESFRIKQVPDLLVSFLKETPWYDGPLEINYNDSASNGNAFWEEEGSRLKFTTILATNHFKIFTKFEKRLLFEYSSVVSSQEANIITTHMRMISKAGKYIKHLRLTCFSVYAQPSIRVRENSNIFNVKIRHNYLKDILVHHTSLKTLEIESYSNVKDVMLM